MIDILLATRNRHACFYECLFNLNEQTVADEINLWVMDGNEGDETAKLLRSALLRFNTVNYYRDEQLPITTRRRWPAIYNFLASKGTASYLSYWSDDVLLKHKRVFEECLDGIGQAGAIAIPFWNEGKSKPILQLVDYPKNSLQPLINYGLIGRSVFQEIGGLDENYEFYFADGDLSARIIMAGYDIVSHSVEGHYVWHTRPEKVWRNPLRVNDRIDQRYYIQKFEGTK